MKLKKWLENRYKMLWDAFQKSNFTFEDAENILKNPPSSDNSKQINVALSELRKAGYLETSFDPKDARKRIYNLKTGTELIADTYYQNGDKMSRGDIEGLLKKAADLIRTRVDYTFILVLLFYKRISDKWRIEFEAAKKEALDDGMKETEAVAEARKTMYHDFDMPQEFSWEQIRSEPGKIAENFSRAMKQLAEKNPELREVFENLDFVQFTNNRENAEILRQLIELFSVRSLHDVPADMLGDAYEWILRYFAPQKAKEGEVYTPREVIQLLIDILDPEPGDYIYDPACGSAGMLITAYQHLVKDGDRKQAEKLFLRGQEANYKTLALAKMNLYIHDIKNAQLLPGDTLLYPKFKKGERLLPFDIVIANPPWNQDGYAEESLKKGEFWHDRFTYGFPTKQSADWAWIQHMLASADGERGKGRVGIVIDNGCLFRGGTEKAIRTKVINEDLLDAVILLPEKLFYNTGAPGAILLFDKHKPKQRKGRVFFINSSSEFEKHPDVRKLNRLGDKNRKAIAGSYADFQEKEGFSRAVKIEEIEKNEFNLNVTLYVYPEEKVEEVNIPQVRREIKEIDDALAESERKLAGYLKELGYEE